MSTNQKPIELIEIENLVHAGKGKLASSKLRNYQRKNKLTDYTRIIISHIYGMMGDLPRAMKVLGSILEKNDLMTCEPERIRLQIRRAHLLNRFGAYHSANNIYNNLFEIEKIRNLKMVEIEKYFYLYHSLLCIYMRKYEQSKESTLKMQSIPEQHVNTRLQVLSRWGDYFLRTGDYQKALETFLEYRKISSDFSELYMAQTYLRAGIIYELLEDFDKSYEEYNKALKFYLEINDKTQLASVYKGLGKLAFIKGKKKDALVLFKKGLECTVEELFSPDDNLELFYNIFVIDPKELSFAQKLSLCCHQHFSDCSFILGKKLDKEIDPPLLPWNKDKYIESSNDCFLIWHELIKYSKYSKKDWIEQEKGRCFDLVSGIIRDVKSGTIEVLTPIQTYCLIALSSSGELGVNLWALADFVYQQDFVNSGGGEERLSKLISQIKKLGVEVELKNNIYYCSLNRNDLWVIPMHRRYYNRLNLVKVFKENFTNQDIQDVYQVSKSTAYKWMTGSED